MSQLVKINVNFAGIGQKVQDAVARGINRCVVEAGIELNQMLSRPGTGRVYVLRNANNKYHARAKKLMKQANVRTISGRHFRYIKRIGLANVLRAMRKRGLKNPKTLRAIGFHKASAPGQPPAMNTGHLARSWQTSVAAVKKTKARKVGNRFVMEIGSNLKYARWLEFGTKHMAARPYVRPVAEIMRRRAPFIIQEEVSKVFAGKGKR